MQTKKPHGRPKGIKKGNEFIKLDKHYEVITSQWKVFLISLDDYEMVKKFTWCIDSHGYPATKYKDENEKFINIRIHRYLMNCERSRQTVDHINRNKLDNRRENLRIVNRVESCLNRSVFKSNKTGVAGVAYREQEGRKPVWLATININKKHTEIGRYKTKEEAIKARKEAELEYYGHCVN